MNNYAFNKYAGEFLKLAQIANYQGRVRALMDVGFSKTAAEKVAISLEELIARQAQMGDTGNLRAAENVARELAFNNANSRANPGLALLSGAEDAAKLRSSAFDAIEKGRAKELSSAQKQIANFLNSPTGSVTAPAYLPGENPLAMRGTATAPQGLLEPGKLDNRAAVRDKMMAMTGEANEGKTILRDSRTPSKAPKAPKAPGMSQGAKILQFLRSPKGMAAAAALGLGGAGAAYGMSQDEPTLLERLQGMAG